MNEQFTNIRKEVSLTETERATMRGVLAALPLPPVSIPSPFYVLLMRPAPVFAFALILVLGTGGGATFAAGKALPGEILYPIKVQVKEEFETYLAPTPRAKAEVAVKHIEERFREAEILAARGEVDEETTEVLSAHIQEHVAHLEATVSTLEESGDTDGAEEIRADASVAFSAHADVLDAQAEDPEATSFALAISGVARTASMSQEGAVDADEEETDRPRVAAQERIEELRTRIENTEEATPDVLAELSDIEQSFENITPENEGYGDIGRRAYRVSVFLSAAKLISEETDTKVVVEAVEPPTQVVGEMNLEVASPAPVMMMAKQADTALAIEATTTPEVPVEPKTWERKFRFRSGN